MPRHSLAAATLPGVPSAASDPGAARAVEFALPVRIYYQHTDAGGIVYHARYLDFMEAARTELLQSLGFDLARLAEREGVLFIVHRAALEYRRPARLNDALTVTARAERIGRARVVFRQSVARGGECLVDGEIQLACVDPATFRPVPVPDAVRVRLGGAPG